MIVTFNYNVILQNASQDAVIVNAKLLVLQNILSH